MGTLAEGSPRCVASRFAQTAPKAEVAAVAAVARELVVMVMVARRRRRRCRRCSVPGDTRCRIVASRANWAQTD